MLLDTKTNIRASRAQRRKILDLNWFIRLFDQVISKIRLSPSPVFNGHED